MSFVAWPGLLVFEFKSLMRGEFCTLGHFALRCRVNDQRPTGKETQLVRDDGGKIGN